ncbi:putative ABC transporter permease [Candidatus Fokinia solitaria]|uniref:Putative ABC transporter permease n=1 Tax=Candidatus Fokinia solitaria TaxID=1802984 RepID=A0A2U8BRN3_9RICK|nr:ABC transporter permease [Candidatus Fokinia solitaria]AWD33016.1 putative ABC transporter permease [Candidatus Fokinia solitaria]
MTTSNFYAVILGDFISVENADRMQAVGAFFAHIGRLPSFILCAIGMMFTKRISIVMLRSCILEFGFFSLPIISLTAAFTGAVLALQSYAGLSSMNPEMLLSTMIVVSITRELGPVLSSLMFTGRVGAKIAAEISSMKNSEQIDAIYTLGVDPIRYLAIPRIVSGMICMPFLVVVADAIGIIGGGVVSVLILDFNYETYVNSSMNALKFVDFSSGLIKAVFFGLISTSVSFYQGFNSDYSASGIGKATTEAVVWSSVLIMFANYILTNIMFNAAV